MRDKIRRWFGAHEREIVADIAKLISFETLTENRCEIARAFDWLMERGAQLGSKTGATADRSAGYMEIGHGGPLIGVLAHIDVVGVGDISLWGEHHPFTLHEQDGQLYGRGAVDDKGPLIISMYALRFLKEQNIPLDKRIRLIIGTSEESEWTDMAAYKREFGTPDCGFSPDGDFPLTNIEKGYCDAELLFSGDWLNSLETLSSGDSPNTIPSRAVIKRQGTPEQVYSGRAVHSSIPWEGDNAILKLAACAECAGLPFARFITDYFAEDCHGVKLGVDDGSDTHNGIFVSRTTACPTILKLTPNGVSLNLNIRPRAGSGEAQIRAAIAAHAAEYGYSFRIVQCSEPAMVPPDAPFLKDMMRLYHEYGFEGDMAVAEGASYASSMPNCVCWGPIFPGEYSCAHQEDERINLQSLLTAGCLYTEFLCYFSFEKEK